MKPTLSIHIIALPLGCCIFDTSGRIGDKRLVAPLIVRLEWQAQRDFKLLAAGIGITIKYRVSFLSIMKCQLVHLCSIMNCPLVHSQERLYSVTFREEGGMLSPIGIFHFSSISQDESSLRRSKPGLAVAKRARSYHPFLAPSPLRYQSLTFELTSSTHCVWFHMVPDRQVNQLPSWWL
jgi:hypothetical protein